MARLRPFHSASHLMARRHPEREVQTRSDRIRQPSVNCPTAEHRAVIPVLITSRWRRGLLGRGVGLARACWNSIESTVPIEKVIGKGTTASVNLEANKQCSYKNPPCPSMFQQGRSESVGPSRESSSAIVSGGWTAISNTINSPYSVDSRPEPWFLINETVLSASGGAAVNNETRPTSHPTLKNTSGNFHRVGSRQVLRATGRKHSQVNSCMITDPISY